MADPQPSAGASQSGPIRKLLVANRGEIAIRIFRSATELGLRTVAVYTHEDRFALHRFKADEAYQVGKPGEPLAAYLDVPNLVALCVREGVDAVHPGYGFLSENANFAQQLEAAGVRFIGPTVDVLKGLGDKTSARTLAKQANVPVLEGTEAVTDVAEAKTLADGMGYPVMLKAAHGGGGRGMRIVRTADELADAFEGAQRESQTAFGSGEIFLERFIERARHIEVQLLGDGHGNLVHLRERDCSVQRRHQKVVEIAPAPNLPEKIRDGLCDAAVKIGAQVNYRSAGTVEFLYDADREEFYFIEVNPRIQVEHTVTEEVTGIDIVKSQILVAGGARLDDEAIGLPSQDVVRVDGFAVQCRVTTEDPANGFVPDYGRIAHYRSSGGPGVRLDAGNAFSGAVVNPFYDSLLVKVTAQGRRFQDAITKMKRTLMEFRIRGVKTNIPFLLKVLDHPTFVAGEATTRFIDSTPDLFKFPDRKNRATKLLRYLGETIVNGNELVKDRPPALRREPAPVPKFDPKAAIPKGSRDKFKELGPEKFAGWIREQERLLITDTTFRDAHQSLLATRVRTKDMLNVADAYAHRLSGLFSIEMWGGATFDVSMRYLKESPWQRLADLREATPNILFQMLLRASNAVGYTNYPDNVVKEFVKETADAGLDLFRVFDALNWTKNMRVAMEAVRETGALCEACLCYTGDLLDPKRTKYDLKYYVSLAKELESLGANILAIKDMAGLCKPEAARKLVKALRDETDLPIHFHTHDTAGIQAASILNAADVGLDVADAAMAPLSGGTAQVNLNTLAEALRFGPRDTELPTAALSEAATYWRAVREYYRPFEADVLPATGDLYDHEMPGGQYTNLFQQARALGLADRWQDVCRIYAEVNRLFGDIVKVTPTSKAVGDMALFLVANEMEAEDVLATDRELSFPQSVVDLIGGAMGQPPGGFPEAVMKKVLRDQEPFTDRPGASLDPADFEKAREEVEKLTPGEAGDRDVLSHLLYPAVFKDFAAHRGQFGDTSGLPTPNFFYGLEPGEEVAVDIEPGKRLIVKFLAIGSPHPDGTRTVFFELNGQPRDVTVQDRSLEADAAAAVKADPADPNQIGSPMPGMVVTVAVQAGDRVKPGQKLLTIEAMKMQTNLAAENEAVVKSVSVAAGSQVAAGDLLVTLEA
ncbi:pyruvate carboxylase [Alienimonas californiensis]|uniref:Pyruvate carboxylase n=1 Tax=Alienimonas californiensis TaxID=2527989 RepID=A0A517PC75_9PLAN|nr:pyruvate carboxylase [Alienimonas californiensis]QDT16956.1 2-oxoglutarate carboxylase small subunit [Alienimonas californiensis]